MWGFDPPWGKSLSYQVIARKWRPQTFEELIGQSHVSQTLLNALKSGRLPHALLFTGPRGVGKTSSARILAKSLKCPNVKNFVPCNQCNVCQEIAAGSNLDVLEIDGASHNGVDSIRELRSSIGYAAASGKYKIYIIDEVHMLSTSAFNALLKTLEEPPAHVIFIFATTEPQKIPVTILSRCQRFDFRRIPTRTIADSLRAICEKEAVRFEPEALWTIARQADGSARDSQSLLDQMITFGDGELTLNKTIDALGLTDRGILLKTLEALIHRSSAEVMGVVEKLYFSGFDAKIFSQDLLEELRHLLLIKLSGALSSIVDLPDSEIQSLKTLGAELSAEDIHLLFDMALKGAQDLQRTQEPRLVLEMVLLRMAQAPRVENLLTLGQKARAPAVGGATSGGGASRTTDKNTDTRNAVTEGISGGAKRSFEAIHPPSAPVTPPSPKAPTVKPGPEASLGDKWAFVVAELKQKAPQLSAKLEHAAAVRWSETALELGVAKEKKFLFDQLTEAKCLRELENHVKNIWSQEISMKFSLLEKAPQSIHEMEKVKIQEKKDLARRDVESHPFIQKTQKIFKTQIKSIQDLPKEGD